MKVRQVGTRVAGRGWGAGAHQAVCTGEIFLFPLGRPVGGASSCVWNAEGTSATSGPASPPPSALPCGATLPPTKMLSPMEMGTPSLAWGGAGDTTCLRKPPTPVPPEQQGLPGAEPHPHPSLGPWTGPPHWSHLTCSLSRQRAPVSPSVDHPLAQSNSEVWPRGFPQADPCLLPPARPPPPQP